VVAMNKQEIISELIEMRRHGWGGAERGVDFEAAVDEATEFIRNLPAVVPAPSLGDTSGGGICLEWTSFESDGHMRVEFRGDGQVGYLVCNGGELREGSVDDPRALAVLIREALAGYKPQRGGWAGGFQTP